MMSRSLKSYILFHVVQFILWNGSSREGMMNEILSYKKLSLNLPFIMALVIN